MSEFSISEIEFKQKDGMIFKLTLAEALSLKRALEVLVPPNVNTWTLEATTTPYPGTKLTDERGFPIIRGEP